MAKILRGVVDGDYKESLIGMTIDIINDNMVVIRSCTKKLYFFITAKQGRLISGGHIVYHTNIVVIGAEEVEESGKVEKYVGYDYYDTNLVSVLRRFFSHAINRDVCILRKEEYELANFFTPRKRKLLAATINRVVKTGNLSDYSKDIEFDFIEDSPSTDILHCSVVNSSGKRNVCKLMEQVYNDDESSIVTKYIVERNIEIGTEIKVKAWNWESSTTCTTGNINDEIKQNSVFMKSEKKFWNVVTRIVLADGNYKIKFKDDVYNNIWVGNPKDVVADKNPKLELPPYIPASVHRVPAQEIYYDYFDIPEIYRRINILTINSLIGFRRYIIGTKVFRDKLNTHITSCKIDRFIYNVAPAKTTDDIYSNQYHEDVINIVKKILSDDGNNYEKVFDGSSELSNGWIGTTGSNYMSFSNYPLRLEDQRIFKCTIFAGE